MSASDLQVAMDILVIDDDPEILKSVGNFLKSQGHRVHQAANGQAGLEILKRESIDILIQKVMQFSHKQKRVSSKDLHLECLKMENTQ